jgi:hypothetical protein
VLKVVARYGQRKKFPAVSLLESRDMWRGLNHDEYTDGCLSVKGQSFPEADRAPKRRTSEQRVRSLVALYPRFAE